MQPITIPYAPLCALWLLERAGHPAYVVGGSLRDALRGEQAHDWDVTTAAKPQQMLKIFAAAGLATVPTGLKHGTVTLIVDHIPVECTTYRLDGDYTDARHPDKVVFTDRVADDLARRDFTVNAMACRVKRVATFPSLADLPVGGLTVPSDELELLDLFGGQKDLADGVLRCVGQADTRFTEDALRILRGVRFCVQLGLVPTPETEAALAACRAGLAKISAERIAAELTRMLTCPRPCREGLELMARTDLWPYVLPEAQHRTPYFERPCALYAAVDALPPLAERRLALLLSGAGESGAKDACRRLKLSNKQTREITTLVSSLEHPLPASDAAARRFAARYGEHSEGTLALRAVCCPHESADVSRALALVAEVRTRGDALTVYDLAVDGKTLMRECGVRGRAVGELLAVLLDAVLDDPAENTPERLLALARAHLSRK